MQDPSKIIYLLAGLIFGAAVIFLVWGSELGVERLLSSVPGPVLFIIMLAALVVIGRFGSGQPLGRKIS
jgi:hypothetical protein